MNDKVEKSEQDQDVLSREEPLNSKVEECSSPGADAITSETKAAIVKVITAEQAAKLILQLEKRFHKHRYRHTGVLWDAVEKKLHSSNKLASLLAMEEIGGEPDVVLYNKHYNLYTFETRSQESPIHRRNLVIDRAAELWLKESGMASADGNAEDDAKSLGLELINDVQYMAAQEVESRNGNVMDQNSWSWLKTSEKVRKTGNALAGCSIGSNFGVQVIKAYMSSQFMAYRAFVKI